MPESTNPFLPPKAPDRLERPRLRRELEFDTVRVTAWAYAIYWLVFVPVYAWNASPHLSVLDRGIQWAMCAPFAAAALSATRGKLLGYYFCLVFSALILSAPPFGTVLGWNMLRALRRNRARFFRRGSAR